MNNYHLCLIPAKILEVEALYQDLEPKTLEEAHQVHFLYKSNTIGTLEKEKSEKRRKTEKIRYFEKVENLKKWEI